MSILKLVNFPLKHEQGVFFRACGVKQVLNQYENFMLTV
jgi:hypothetical protein